MKNVKSLLESAAEVDIIPIKENMPDNAEVIGKLSEELQRLKSLWILSSRKTESLQLEIQHCDSDEKEKELRLQHFRALEKTELLKNAFWYEVKCEFPGCEKYGATMGISPDFEVYIFERISLADVLMEYGGVASFSPPLDKNVN